MAVTVKASPFLSAEDGLVGPFPAKCPTLFPERCLNSVYRQANCARCVDACPVAAIQLDDTSVTLDHTSCLRCGVCRLACPVAVFVETTTPETRLVEAAHDGNDTSLELACPWVTDVNTKGEPILKSRLPRVTCLATARCLGAFSPADLLELTCLGERKIWLHDAACPDCPLSRTQDRLLASADEANAWLAGYGQPPSVCTYSQSAEALDNKPAPRPVSPVPAENTRRAFLRRVTGVEAVSQTRLAEPHYERERILSKLARMEQPSYLRTSKLPLANVQINPKRCSACGLCAKCCPTGTLKFATDKDTFTLAFSARTCVDCGLCAMTCPDAAISYGDSLAGSLLFDRQPTRLVAGELVHCVTCNAPVAHTSSNRQCFICRRRGSRPAYLETP